MNVFNVHSNRSPIESTVQQKWYAGSFQCCARQGVAGETSVVPCTQDQDGRDITFVQIAGPRGANPQLMSTLV